MGRLGFFGGGSARLAARRSLVAGLVLAGTFALSSAQAFAETHKFSKVLPEPTSPAKPFSEPWGVAVGTGGEVFVSNKGSRAIDVYSSSGVFEKEFTAGTGSDEILQVAVDRSSEAGDTSKGDLYIVDFTANKVYRYTKSGTEDGSPISVAEPRAVAVDSKGDVYVARRHITEEEEKGFIIGKYGPKGELIKEQLVPETGGAGEFWPSSLAIDSSDNVYLDGENGVHEYSSVTGACLSACAAVGLESLGAVAIGPEGNVYESKVKSGEPKDHEIKAFKPGSTGEVESFDSAHPVEEVYGFALSGTTVYAASSNANEVAVFTEGPAQNDLTLEKGGTGQGTVESGPSGIDCGPSCSQDTAEFAENEKVTLTATPETGSTFTGWTGCAVEPSPSECEVTMTEAKIVKANFKSDAATFPLTLLLTGQGEVISSPAGITCSTEECTSEFAGKVTLTVAHAASGYEFAGWIGCKHVTASSCEVNVTAAIEVTAVFLKQAQEGKEGKEGTAGKEGEEGAPGKEGKEGKEGNAGGPGATGEKGATGAAGGPGAQGSTGPVGPAGAQGPAGPAGKIDLVTCTKKGKTRHCTTKLISGTVKFSAAGASARATLSRHGMVFAAGTAQTAGSRLRLRLASLRKLRPGRYTLTLTRGAGRHRTIHTVQFDLR